MNGQPPIGNFFKTIFNTKREFNDIITSKAVLKKKSTVIR